jgi:lipopolysaccharide export system protein LptA
MCRGLKGWHQLVFCFLFLVLFPGLILAQRTPPGSRATNSSLGIPLQSDSPLKIASDRMEANQNDRTVLFEGHVIVHQDDLTITGKRLKVYAAESLKDGGSQSAMVDKIDRIEMEGDVTITQQDKVATAQRAVYYHQEQKIVLSGQPMVSQGEDRIQGRLITLLIAQGKSIVEGGAETPVQALLHPGKKE